MALSPIYFLYVKINLIPAIINTTPNDFFTPSSIKYLIPNWVPMSAPNITANEYKQISEGKDLTMEMLPNKPAVELNKINKAAVPYAPFTEVQPRNTIKGDKNIPPPVPVKPDINPINNPAKNPRNGLTSFLTLSEQRNILKRNCNPPTIRIKPTKGR